MELSVSSVSVVMLLSVFVHDVAPHRSERTVPRVVPSKLQLFEYANLTVNCEGFFNNMTQWRVLRKVSGRTTPCNKNSKLLGPCHMTMVYTDDSGEYWCESKDQQTRSESVNITVTAGDVVLESPVHPVMVGDNVTLRCVEKKKKKPSTEFIFFKDGAELNTSSTGEMTIHNISESDQGLYRCSTSDTEFSGENLLRVRESSTPFRHENVVIDDHKNSSISVDRDHSSIIIIVSLPIGLGGLLIAFIFILNKVNESDEESAEATISDGEKPELCSFSRRVRGPALVDATDWEVYTTVIYSEKHKDV